MKSSLVVRHDVRHLYNTNKEIQSNPVSYITSTSDRRESDSCEKKRRLVFNRKVMRIEECITYVAAVVN